MSGKAHLFVMLTVSSGQIAIDDAGYKAVRLNLNDDGR